MPLNDTVYWEIYSLPWATILAILFTLVIIWILCDETAYRSQSRKTFNFWKAFNIVCTAFTLLLILSITVFLRVPDPSTIRIQLIPFHSFILAKQDPALYRALFLNMCLYIPFGLLFTGSFEKKRRTPKIILLVTFASLCISAATEITQYVYILGNCEVDDVIMNTFGASLGSSIVIYWHFNSEGRYHN